MVMLTGIPAQTWLGVKLFSAIQEVNSTIWITRRRR
jgi:hypothetical protein